MTRRRSKAAPQAFPNDRDLLIGRLEGKLDGIAETQKKHDKRFDQLDTRIRRQETFAAGLGAVAGLVIAIGVESVKSMFRKN